MLRMSYPPCKKLFFEFIDFEKYEKIHNASEGINKYCPLIFLKEKIFSLSQKRI